MELESPGHCYNSHVNWAGGDSGTSPKCPSNNWGWRSRDVYGDKNRG